MFALSMPGPLHSVLSRRRLLQIGLLVPGGFARPAFCGDNTVAGRRSRATFGRAKRCILVFLNGGPSQLDTWDMKPGAAAEVRGELRPISTNVAGIHVSELLPHMAKIADRYKIVRSVTHDATVHTTGVYTMLTGTFHATPKVDQTQTRPTDHPHLGSVYARWRGWRDGTPPFVSLPTLFRAPPVDGIWPGQTAGFLGRRFDPLVIDGEKRTARFCAPDLELPTATTKARMDRRQELLGHMIGAQATSNSTSAATAWDEAYRQGWALLDSAVVRRAVDLDRESSSVRERYGSHLFGQGLLLARRLIEANVPLVTMYWIDPTPPGPGGGEFDSHGRIYHHMRERLLPPTDQGLSALVADLWNRGLHNDTLLVVFSEFGRTPTINKDAGRDHWPFAQSILLAGAGITGGTVYGATDKHGAYPTARSRQPPEPGKEPSSICWVSQPTLSSRTCKADRSAPHKAS